MAVQERLMVKHFATTGGTLQAQANESLRILDVVAYGGSAIGYVSLAVNGVTVAKYRSYGKSGNHIPPLGSPVSGGPHNPMSGILRWLNANGIDMTIPVGSGELLTVTWGTSAATAVDVIYATYDAADMKPSMPNGSMALTRRYLHYMDNAAAVTTTPLKVDNSLLPSGWNPWPIGGLGVPVNTKFQIDAIVAAPAAKGAGSVNAGYTKTLRIFRGEEALYDLDRAGLSFLGDASYTTPGTGYTSINAMFGPLTDALGMPPLLLNPPEVFQAGEVAAIEIDLGATGGNNAMLINAIDLCLVMEMIIGSGK